MKNIIIFVDYKMKILMNSKRQLRTSGINYNKFYWLSYIVMSCVFMLRIHNLIPKRVNHKRVVWIQFNQRYDHNTWQFFILFYLFPLNLVVVICSMIRNNNFSLQPLRDYIPWYYISRISCDRSYLLIIHVLPLR